MQGFDVRCAIYGTHETLGFFRVKIGQNNFPCHLDSKFIHIFVFQKNNLFMQKGVNSINLYVLKYLILNYYYKT